MRLLTFHFGGNEYQVKEPTYRQAKAWRTKLEAKLTDIASLAEGDLINVLNEAAALNIPTNAAEAGQAAEAGEFGQAADILAKLSPALSQIGRLALSSIDEAADLLFSYGPDIAEKREELEEVAYSDEIIAALWVVINSAYPFLTIRQVIRDITDQLGQNQTRITTNFGDPNGTPGQAITKKT